MLIPERFTPAAVKIVFQSRYVASQWGSPTVEPWHIALALKPSLRPRMEREHAFERGGSVNIPLSDGSKRVFELADLSSEEMINVGDIRFGVNDVDPGLLE